MQTFTVGLRHRSGGSGHFDFRHSLSVRKQKRAHSVSRKLVTAVKCVTDCASKCCQERSFLCACLVVELTVSVAFYAARTWIFPRLCPDTVLIVYCVRTQTSQTVSLLLIFAPKFWYQQKQVRHLAQEYSCRFPLDAFKVSVIQVIVTVDSLI